MERLGGETSLSVSLIRQLQLLAMQVILLAVYLHVVI